MLSVGILARTILAIATPFVAAQSSNSPDGSEPTATIDSGPIIGISTQLPGSSSSVNQFLGIPFAQPPVDNLRFAPPQEPESWEEPYEATTQPLACIQYSGPEDPSRDMSKTLFYNPPAPGESEDCLYVNVYAPSGGDPHKPVMFWLYGGSGTGGAISMPLYDGTNFAANQDVVVVAAAYRVNVFGNPRSPQIELQAGNPGLLDQRLALDWVQRNAHAFGGDPDKVTIMGESAGAVSVGNLINTYPDDPPFRAGVLMSGSSVVKIPPPLANDDTETWDTLVELLNCSSTSDEVMACMRDVSVETIRETMDDNALVFGEPVMDENAVISDTAAAWLTGNVAKVPILIGSTQDDGSFFVYNSSATVYEFVVATFGVNELGQLVDSLYSEGGPGVPGLTTDQQRLSKLVTDFLFACSSGFAANMTTTLLDVPAWQYVFNATVPSNTFEEWPELGVWHSSEIAMVFGTYPREGSDELEARLSESMQKMFADFIKNPKQGPGWDQYPRVAVLGVSDTDVTTTMEDMNTLNPVCQQWDVAYLTQMASVSRLSPEDLAALPDGAAGNETGSGADNAGEIADETSTASQPSFCGRSVILAGLLGFAAILY